MKLRINARDYKLVEDDYGNPIFRFLGIHPSDLDDIIRRVNSNEEEIEDLRDRLAEAEDKLYDIRNLL